MAQCRSLPLAGGRLCAISLFLFAMEVSSAAAMDDAERKVQDCRSNSQSLIGLDRDELRSRCGPWDSVDVISVQNRRVETLTWGNPKTNPLLIVYVGNGKVTAAQSF